MSEDKRAQWVAGNRTASCRDCKWSIEAVNAGEKANIKRKAEYHVADTRHTVDLTSHGVMRPSDSAGPRSYVRSADVTPDQWERILAIADESSG